MSLGGKRETHHSSARAWLAIRGTSRPPFLPSLFRAAVVAVIWLRVSPVFSNSLYIEAERGQQSNSIDTYKALVPYNVRVADSSLVREQSSSSVTLEIPLDHANGASSPESLWTVSEIILGQFSLRFRLAIGQKARGSRDAQCRSTEY